MASGRLYSNMTALRSLTLDTGPGEMESTIPRDIVAGTGTDPRPRLLVEPDQVAFFEGRMFRIFNEFNIAAGQSAYFKFVLTGDIIVTSRELVVVEGRIRASTILGGTEAGTWTAYTIGRQNNMASQPQPPFTSGTTVFTGGWCLVGWLATSVCLRPRTRTPQCRATAAPWAYLPAQCMCVWRTLVRGHSGESIPWCGKRSCRRATGFTKVRVCR